MDLEGIPRQGWCVTLRDMHSQPVDGPTCPRINGRAWRGCPRIKGRAFSHKRSRPYLDPVLACISNTSRRSGTSRGQPCGLTTASTAPTTCPCPFGAPPTGGWFFLPLILALAGCTAQSPEKDLAQCRIDMRAQQRMDTNERRFTFLDDCMTAKGWKASSQCRQNNLQGTASCTYER